MIYNCKKLYSDVNDGQSRISNLLEYFAFFVVIILIFVNNAGYKRGQEF